MNDKIIVGEEKRIPILIELNIGRVQKTPETIYESVLH